MSMILDEAADDVSRALLELRGSNGRRVLGLAHTTMKYLMDLWVTRVHRFPRSVCDGDGEAVRSPHGDGGRSATRSISVGCPVTPKGAQSPLGGGRDLSRDKRESHHRTSSPLLATTCVAQSRLETVPQSTPNVLDTRQHYTIIAA